MNRLSLYVFYEKNGNLRESDRYYLKGLREVSDAAVIVNGKISKEGAEFLRNEGYEVFCRKNIGFDFAAWKEYLESHFSEITGRYDEIILCNCSCYGPVFPLDGIFRKMDASECDFWGLYRHPGIPGVFPPHLQSYFIVLRRRLFWNKSFTAYIRELKPAENWNEAVGQETHFTEYFENKGFVSASFIDDGLSGIYPDATIILPEKLLEQGFPFVKRKAFSVDYRLIQSFTDGSYIRPLIDFLKTKTEYPLDLIRKDVTRSMPASQLKNLFHLTYALKSEPAWAGAPAASASESSVAAILYSYFDDLIDQDFGYLSSLPENSHVFIVVVSERMKALWENRLKSSSFRYEIRIQQNRGRNEAAYWITCRDVIESFDYICLVHDKKTMTAHPPVKGLYWSSHCWNSVLFSPEYVRNIISVFDSNPGLGILMPTAPIFAEWPDLIFNREWAGDLDIALKVYGMLSLTVPFDDHPSAPWGGMFWVRGMAMKALYRHAWTVNDLPEEPIKVPDGTVLHALERMYPMIAQESGFLSGWIVPSDLVGTYYDNLYFKAVEYKTALDEYKTKCDGLSNAVKRLHEELDARKQAEDEEFYAEGYLEMYPDVAKAKIHPMRHYVLYGKKEGRDNGLHPDESLFFAKGYLAMYTDVAESGVNPWRHYVECGKKEGRDNGLHPKEDEFFGAGYLEMYQDVANAGMDPWRHYAEYGRKEGRDTGLHPSPEQFSAEGYLKMYPDVAKAGIDPWRHYVEYGKKEGRCNGLGVLK